MATTKVQQTAAPSSLEALKTTAKNSGEALVQSSKAALSGLQSLAQAYQSIITRNVEHQLGYLNSITSVKTLHDAVDVQTQAVKNSFEAIVADSQALFDLTSDMLTEAFHPVKKHVEETFQVALPLAA